MTSTLSFIHLKRDFLLPTIFVARALHSLSSQLQTAEAWTKRFTHNRKSASQQMFLKFALFNREFFPFSVLSTRA
jgi:hypothetical protein